MLVEPIFYKRILKLSFPVILSLTGGAVVQMADVIMVGRLGKLDLASVSFASSIILFVMVVGIGFAMGLTPLVGKSYSQGGFRKVGFLFFNSIILNVIIGVLLVLILVGIYPLFFHMGQDATVIENSKSYYIIVAISLFPMFMFISIKQFLEGLGNTKVAMWITLVCNLLNIFLNYVLIYGKFGSPAYGITGAAIATFISRVIGPIIFFIYIAYNNPYKRFLGYFKKKFYSQTVMFEVLKVGFPISSQMFSECLSLSFQTVMMGWVSVVALGANIIIHSIFHFTFMICNGIASSCTILVSHALGKDNMYELKSYASAAVHLSIIVMSFIALLFIFCGKYIAMIFTNDPEMINLCRQLFYIAAILQIADGVQIVKLGALRGIMDVKFPMKWGMVIYVFLCIPLSYLLGFTFGLGAHGVFSGFVISITIATIIWTLRFNYSKDRIL